MDVKRFFHGETKAGAMMFENGYVQQKIRPAYNRARIECRGRKPFIHESRFESISHPMHFVRSVYPKGIDDHVSGIAIHRTEDRRVGTECFIPCTLGVSPDN